MAPSSHPRRLNNTWKAPKISTLNLNTDGAMGPSTMAAACRGAIQNSNGDWITGFCRNIGHYSAFQAELWGVLDGLELACNLGINQIEVELDNNEVVNQLGSQPSNHEHSIVRRIRNYLDRSWKVNMRYVPRDANKLTDSIAKLGRSQPLGRTVITQPPAEVQYLLNSDQIEARRRPTH
ncbi:hypothetical protein F3Y22_tig00110015pilonHSYRG00037 [Hibiscus syriacus]|uniref:RNase H type-1 domain-containing protein n=1 Tax=Hibiscus syriacus TaxID=106335 RepID=A0A6A3BNW5_HIBSY|nr:hypothetical protein F3Y22_tig00110015pilonHSYRG00037 [Hibiscus syriacus]